MLLCLLSVGREGLWERVCWGCWVSVGSVVDLCATWLGNVYTQKDCEQSHTGGDGALAEEANHGLAALLQYLGCMHCGRGWEVE